ncbi:glycerophosphodiester phosphodiesterase family protein [Flavihumibacter sp. UBA7668]|uniref:glycerophosphodiester phosphodiesterase family protein n=1 Tax=Flavihumibacter sp. UBA7668 TaxID=1946542 RepID=UPI0025BF7CF6|nr:glycerophosphodiester phosphodiesterase family protein [Flavihumibacter sp. UBA7668]
MNKIILFLTTLCTGFIGFAQHNDLNAGVSRTEELRREFMQGNGTTVMVAAHRGVHNDVPENSMASFHRAAQLRVHIVELDVRSTRDGVLVLMHDKTVDRTTNGRGRVDSLTYAELSALSLKHKGQVTTEKIPTLEEALLFLKGKTLVDLDIKAGDKSGEIMELVRKTGTERTVIFFVYDSIQLRMVKEWDKDVLVLARSRSHTAVAPYFGKFRPEALHIDESHHRPDVVKQIHSSGARVWLNALGETDRLAASTGPHAFNTVLQYGANIIQTDYPELLLKYLKGRN